MEEYKTYTLDNGLRIVHKPLRSSVAYCGVIVDVGSRDENSTQEGIAHFIEHLLFKGTIKRKATQIINRLEDVGGSLNAYTTKEETVVYAEILKQYTQRAIELVADMLQNAIFPTNEIKKEIEVVKDEILSYQDTPSELIVDEFEEMIMGQHPLSHSILGNIRQLTQIDQVAIDEFYQQHYTLNKMVFFSTGNLDFQKIIQWCEKYFVKNNTYKFISPQRKPIENLYRKEQTISKNTYQVHTLIGGKAYDMNHDKRVEQGFLNNIIGGPNMNSMLNLSLRERNGLVYNVESILQTFTDTGWWGIYFGTDAENQKKSLQLVYRVLEKIKMIKISEYKLNKYKKQLIGQLVIASENQENTILSLAKSYLRYGKQDPLSLLIEDVQQITATQLQEVANELYDTQNLSILKYI